MLGERIRKIRKQKKITLEALAGEELTKGMLSLIENNKANPSMESLSYIAERLGVDVAELLEEIGTHERREILEKAEKLFNSADETGKYKRLIALIEPVTAKISHGYESARLLDIYCRCLYGEKKDGWQEFSDRAAKLYDEMNLTGKRVEIGMFRARVKFNEHDYTQSLAIFLKERSEIEANHAYIDPMTQVELDYNEAIYYFAVGNSDAATRVMESAIDFSKQHRIFYRINDLYRLAAAQALMTHDAEKKEHYLLKLKQYGEFAEHLMSIIFYDLFQVMSLISEKHDYIKALELVDQYFTEPKMADIFEFWYLLEKGKALYGLERYHEAIYYLEKVKIPTYVHHPFDLSMFYIMDSYKALCHLELGNKAEALQKAQTAAENFKFLPSTPFKDFAFETQAKIEKAKPSKEEEDNRDCS